MLNKKLANSKKFWARYEWRLQDDFTYSALEDHPIKMNITEEAALLIDTGDDFSYLSLLFEEKGKELLEIAWDDEAYFHPFVLRMEEWELLSRHIAAQHNTEQWIPALLLQRFVGYSSLSELKAVIRLGMEMRQQSGLYTPTELENWPEHPMLKDETLLNSIDRKWLLEAPYGWILEGKDSYSLRNADNPDFPYNAWNRMIAGL
ncbi:hypothetical protein [Paenibacillus sp. NPDC058174]|uniref:hypothetical protein n=1 Tax=Paenibacillus sp. NPDC058174 TaxID=3346366 RepID=UPI0036D893F8